MARLPSKIVRFLVWSSASSELRDDALNAFDEGFMERYERFGRVYAHWWSVSQAVRSLPYGVVANLIRIGILLAGLVT